MSTDHKHIRIIDCKHCAGNTPAMKTNCTELNTRYVASSKGSSMCKMCEYRIFPNFLAFV